MSTTIFQNFYGVTNEHYVVQHLTAPYYDHFFTLKLK